MQSPASLSPLSTAALVALQRGNKIDAIKIVRRERGLGLKDAKEFVEAHLTADPALASAFGGATSRGRSFMQVAFLIGTCALFVYFFLLRR
jgi:hypothetical protein